jgi:MFS family permease
MVDVVAAPQQARTDASLRTLAAISTAHWVSHFHFMVPPMLFPFLKEQLGVDYLELGFALTVFAVVSALTQAPMGYIADHIGARKVLLMGLTLGGLALIMIGLHLSYSWLIASAVLLGLANSVYHPADYAILSAHMDDARMGRAFSIHTFAGFFGGAVAPAVVAALVATIGGYGALIVAGAVGPLVALMLVVVGIPDASAADRKVNGVPAPRQSIITPAIIVLTIFFMLLSLSNAGISNFGVVALMSGYGASFSSANIALTAFLGASAIGVLAGGFLADRTRRHGQVAAVCFAVNAGHRACHRDHQSALAVADGRDGRRGIPRWRDRALARYAGPRRRTGRRGRPRVRYRHHRLHSRRYRQPAAVWLDHGSELAAMGVRRLRRVHDPHGPARACHRPPPSGPFRNAGCKADASLSLIPAVDSITGELMMRQNSTRDGDAWPITQTS